MADRISINDFVEWSIQQIDPAQLSALMTRWDYTTDDADSVIHALENIPQFADEYARLLGINVARNEQETQLNTGAGLVSGTVGLDYWRNAVSRQSLTRAKGIENDATAEKSAFDWGGLAKYLIGTAGEVASKAWGKQPVIVNNPTEKKSTDSNVFMYVIVGVVVLAVIAVMWMSLAKKK